MLYENVRAYVLTTDYKAVSKETLAEKFRAREHEVHEVLKRLNHEGIVSQPTHTPHCYDHCRKAGHVIRRSCYGYSPDYYTILKKLEDLDG